MMKFKIYLLFFLISFSVFGLTKSEIIKMTKMGLPESTLMATVNGSKDVIVMEKADIIEMKKANVPNSVIKALIKRYLNKKRDAKKSMKGTDSNKLANEAKMKEKKAKEEEVAKIRAEEERKTEERIKKRESAQLRREYREKRLPLDRAISLYNKKEYFRAIKKLYKFLKSDFKQSSNEYYLARFYLGMSFYKLKANSSAIKVLKDVLIRGPQVKIGKSTKGAYFMLAFEAYGKLTGDWPFSSDFNETYQMVSTYNTGLLPKKFQDVYNYYMGKYYTKWASNSSKAQKYLSKIKVIKISKDKNQYPKYYASSQYLLGLNKVKSKKYNESVKHFQNVILAVQNKTSFKDTSLRDLAYIALGRIYYEIASSYFSVGGIEQAQRLANASLESYRKVSKDSPKLAAAYHEASWAAFITGEYDISLGYLHSLHSAYLKNYYYPDEYILEAGIYVNMCLFKYADEAVSAFKKKYDPFKKELDDFLSEPLEPKEYLEKVKKISSNKPMKGKRFSYELISYIISDSFFYENYKALKIIENEKSILAKWSKKGKSRVLPHLNKLYVRILKKEDKLYRSLGSWIRRKLQNASNNLDELYLKSDEISFEIISAEKRELQNEKNALTQKTKIKKSNNAKSSKEYNLKDDEMMWKFTGEYWIDEIDNYHSFLQSKCK